MKQAETDAMKLIVALSDLVSGFYVNCGGVLKTDTMDPELFIKERDRLLTAAENIVVPVAPKLWDPEYQD